jgi:serine/threonine protein kinase
MLENRYRLGDVLGHGGMSEVRRAWDVRLQRPVAIKLFQFPRDEVGRRRFTEEARTMACLSHPGLVTVYDTGDTEDGTPYLILHLVDGPTLRERINDGPMPEDTVRAIGAQLADTLAHVHEHDITHRDVKPSNILLDADGTPYLADFGIAKQTDTTSLTTTGEVIGTAGYLAPEQVRGGEITHAVDIYALGLVLLECLTGQREYVGTDVEAALARLTRPIHVPEHISQHLGTILRMMTSLAPRRRPTAERCAQLLRDPDQLQLAEKPTLQGEPVPVPVSAAVPVPVAPAPRRRRKAAFAATSLAAAGLLAFAITKHTQPIDSAPLPPPPAQSSTPTPAQVNAITSTSSTSSTTVQPAPKSQSGKEPAKGKGKDKGKKTAPTKKQD